MIVSASRRTDLPAAYAPWLRRRIREGRARVRHPFRPSAVREVDLRPAPRGAMDALVLWTRNPGPLLDDLPGWERDGIRTLWLVTVTGYPRALEPAAPPTEDAIQAVGRLARLVGPGRVAWRYDPVLVVPGLGLDPRWHRENFGRLAARLAPHVDHAIVSWYDPYRAAEQRLARAGLEPVEEGVGELAAALAEEARREGLPLQSCCEPLEAAGIPAGACIDENWIHRVWGLPVSGRRDPGQRNGCRCAPSVDIGAYDTCPHGCLYCYATRSPGRAAAFRARHDPGSEALAP
ncbi:MULTISPECIES: DUF1848 domain-containing protein [Deferrisoma]